MLQQFKPYLNTDYTYTPYVHELSDNLDTNEVLVIGNLLNKLNSFNADLTIHHTDNISRYHYYYNQKEIYTKELRSFSRSTLGRTLKSLRTKGLIECHADKNPNGKGYDTTYYFINTEAISKLMVRDDNVPVSKKNGADYLLKSKNKSNKDKDIPKSVMMVRELNEIQKRFDQGEIEQMEYNALFQPLKKQIQSACNKLITRNKTTKLWEIA
ncbi:putative transcriptional regulator [Dysgonomonas sp. PFB1-18]|uniref:hypothetical protein n=1 Tax=unclassified Dysgonomonas TaxID=2630389 RepID=UPI00247388E3|nr:MULTISPECIES: hypothetical protein [unclassified Dysgonomonas]MDH6307415.1 putative transcriptional regulator [Dysgonomonas sp. PF1-14]MDH6337333.1 putative transcriptional regulator [Dysgonomonas sp. PF1-16]MDH6379257.1 putative transcriptional regulator [Dysgonomonas sp. PFB1-18]MDH6396105.1 putative transcriptional regulator [Dysgonomonas sp. PF1-23]